MLDEKLKIIEDKYNEINEKLMQPEIINDQDAYRNYMKEYKELTPLVEKYKEYSKAKASFDEAVELLEAGGLDKEFKEMVQLQYDESKRRYG